MCYRPGKYTVFTHVPALFSPDILQAEEMKGLTHSEVQKFAFAAVVWHLQHYTYKNIYSIGPAGKTTLYFTDYSADGSNRVSAHTSR